MAPASAAGTHSISTMLAPASASARASARMRAASSPLFALHAVAAKGVDVLRGQADVQSTPGCRARDQKRVVSAMKAPPSSLTMCAPACISLAALANACCGLSWWLPNGMSPMISGVARAARHAADVIGHFFQADRQG